MNEQLQGQLADLLRQAVRVMGKEGPLYEEDMPTPSLRVEVPLEDVLRFAEQVDEELGGCGYLARKVLASPEDVCFRSRLRFSLRRASLAIVRLAASALELPEPLEPKAGPCPPLGDIEVLYQGLFHLSSALARISTLVQSALKAGETRGAA